MSRYNKALSLFTGAESQPAVLRIFLDSAYQPICAALHIRWVSFPARRKRWDIENFGFNELVNGWEADHIYKHDGDAIEAFLLMAFLAYNLFHAFLGLNLKPQLRDSKPEKYWACLIAAQRYTDAGTTPLHAP